MSAATNYLTAAAKAIQALLETQTPAIEAAADLLADAAAGDRRIFSFGASHSFMITEELVYRSGGLMLINPIYPHGMNFSVHPLTATSSMERLPGLGRELLAATPAQEGDVLLLTSTSGRNHVIIDMALQAREMKLRTIAITALAYSRGVASRHPSGKKLSDLADVVIDNAAPQGDAAVAIKGFSQKVGPLSSVTGCAIANAISTAVVERLVRRGLTPPVFMSANLDGGDAHNARLLAANRHRIFYM